MKGSDDRSEHPPSMLQLRLQCNIFLLFFSNAHFQMISCCPRVKPSLATHFLITNKLLKL